MPHSPAFEKATQETLDALHQGRDALRIKYQIAQGRQLAPGCYENQEEVMIGPGLSLSFFRRKNPGETGDVFPGRFVGSLLTEEAVALLKGILASPLHQSSLTPASPTDALHRLQLNLSGRPFAFTWGPHSPNEREARLPALLALAGLLTHPSLKPRWSLALELEKVERDTYGFTASLRLRNLGSESIACVIPSEGHAIASLQLYHAIPVQNEPGITPLPLEVSQSEGIPSGSTAPIQSIPPGGSVLFRSEFDAPTQPQPLHLKFAYRQWALPEDFAGSPLFQGEVFSEETLA